MDLVVTFVDLFVHLDEHLATIIQQYGSWTYFILFCIIFCETGLVVTPFLPGDSLLFAAGALAALADSNLHMGLLLTLLMVAAILGDTVNYWIGHRVGARVYDSNSRWVNREHLQRTHVFFERHGGKTILLARFMPIIRTFAPFVAGVGQMTYAYFLSYNLIGGILWVALFTLGGYFFGNLPVVRDNFTLVIFAIILISLLPPVYEFVRNRPARRSLPTDNSGV